MLFSDNYMENIKSWNDTLGLWGNTDVLLIGTMALPLIQAVNGFKQLNDQQDGSYLVGYVYREEYIPVVVTDKLGPEEVILIQRPKDKQVEIDLKV